MEDSLNPSRDSSYNKHYFVGILVLGLGCISGFRPNFYQNRFNIGVRSGRRPFMDYQRGWHTFHPIISYVRVWLTPNRPQPYFLSSWRDSRPNLNTAEWHHCLFARSSHKATFNKSSSSMTSPTRSPAASKPAKRCNAQTAPRMQGESLDCHESFKHVTGFIVLEGAFGVNCSYFS